MEEAEMTTEFMIRVLLWGQSKVQKRMEAEMMTKSVIRVPLWGQNEVQKRMEAVDQFVTWRHAAVPR